MNQITTLAEPLAESEFASMVVSALDETNQPNPLPACATCPESLWYITERGLSNYCGAMGAITWDRKSKPVMSCDGKAAAILEILAKRKSKEAKLAKMLESLNAAIPTEALAEAD